MFSALARIAVHHRRAVLAVCIAAVIGGLAAVPSFLARLEGADYSTPGSSSYTAGQYLAKQTGFSEFDTLVFSSERLLAGSTQFGGVVKAGVAAAKRVDPSLLVLMPGSPGGGQISPDRHILTATVGLTGSAAHRQKVAGHLETALSNASRDGVAAGITGDSPLLGDLTRVEKNSILKSEAAGLPIAVVILLIAFGSVVAAGLPILLGISGLTVSFGIVAALMTFRHFNAFVESAMAMVGLAIGIDYALLLVRRYKEERAIGGTDVEVMSRTLNTAGRTILFSGLILSTTLVPLVVTGLPYFSDTGLAVIVVVLAEVALLLTLLPAVLLTLGSRLERGRLPRRRGAPAPAPPGSGRWYRWAHGVMRRPVPILLIGTTLLLLAASPVLSLRTGIDLNARAMSSQPSVRPLIALKQHFPAAAVEPLEVVVRSSPEKIATVSRAVDGVLRASSRIATTESVPIGAGSRLVAAVPTVGADTSAAEHLVISLRGQLDQAVGHDGSALVAGVTADTVDYTHDTNAVTPWVIGAALVLSFLLLVWLFRSPVLAVKAIVMNLLSIGAAIGLTVLVFQDGHGQGLLGFTSAGYLQSWTPLMLFVVLFGLSMDYEVFMVTRIREEWVKTQDTAEAVARGLERTGAVVTYAATIMAAIFASFLLVVIPEMKQLGFALAVAVLVDATLVRSLLVPAFMKLAGRWNWWLPEQLDRRLPQLQL